MILVLNEMKVYTCRIIVCWTVPQGTCYLIKSGNAPDLLVRPNKMCKLRVINCVHDKLLLHFDFQDSNSYIFVQ